MRDQIFMANGDGVLFKGSTVTRQSVAVQRDGASQLAKKYPL